MIRPGANRLTAPALLLAGASLAASFVPIPSAAYNLDQNSAVFGLLNAADENSWVQLNQNSFDSAWAPADQTLQHGNRGRQHKIIEAWSSFAWDSNRGKLIFWGGGHANYLGNDVYTFNINNLLWERASLPSAIKKPAPNNFPTSYTSVDGVDHAPISSHTYDSQFYFRNADRFVTMGGAAYNDGDTFRRYVQNPDGSYRKVRTGPYFWDPAKADPNKVGGLTGSHINPGSNPGIVGGEMWENRDSAHQLGNTYSVNTTSAVDPDPTVDRALLQNNRGLYEYIVPDVNDPSLDTFTHIGRFGNSAVISRKGTAGFDPIRNIYVRSLDSRKNKNNAFTFWDLSATSGDGSNCPTSTLICNALVHEDDIDVIGGTFDYQNTSIYALDFDPNRNAFLLWAGIENVWSLKLPADLYNGRWTLTKLTGPGETGPGVASEINPHSGVAYGQTGILGSWKYVAELDVFLGSQDGRGEIWAFKPANWQYADDSAVIDPNPDPDPDPDPDPSGGPLVADDFSDGNLNGWLNVSEGDRSGPSNWKLLNGRVCQTSNVHAAPGGRDSLPKIGGYLQYVDGSFTNAEISLTMNSGDDDAIGVMFRVQDSQNYYRFSWDRQRSYRRLVKSVNGVFTLLAEDSTPYSSHRDYDVSISSNGLTHAVTIDGDTIFTVNDGDIASGTIALYTWGNESGCFDNVEVNVSGDDGGNAAPVIQSITATPAQITDRENSLLSVSASDDDGDSLTYQWEVPASSGSFDNPTSETPTFSPNSVFSPQNVLISVSVSDGISVRSSEVMVTVTPSGTSNSFSDNFDDGNLDGWLNVSEGNRAGPSNWQLRDGRVCQTSNIYSTPGSRDILPKLGSYLQYVDSNFADAEINLTMNSGDDDTVGLMFRVQDSQNYYRFSWDRQRSYRRLVKSVNGVFTLLAEDSVRYDSYRDYDVSITSNGPNHSVAIDGNVIFAVTDRDIASGSIALYTWGNESGCFDDLVVNEPNGNNDSGNTAPVIQSVTATPAQITDQESSLLSVSASDNDGDSLTYLWELPAGAGSFDNPASETPIFSPNNVFSPQNVVISVSVSDGVDVSSRQVTVTVSPSGASNSFFEDFDDGNFNGWTIFDDAPGSSIWRVRDGVLEQTSNIHAGPGDRDTLEKNGTYLKYDDGINLTNFNASLTLRSKDNDALGVMFRVQDNDNYYRFSWDRERKYRRLVKKVNGVFTLLAEDSVPHIAFSNHQLEIDAVGQNLQITVDGRTIFSVVDNDISSGTIGLYCWGNAGSYFDDILVIQ